MAYDIEIPTPRGRIGLNIGFNGLDTVIMGYLQQSDGTWKYGGMIPVAEGETSGRPDAVLAECLRDEGIAGDVATWIANTSQEDAMKVIRRWLSPLSLSRIVAFVNRLIGVIANPNPNPTPPPTSTFATSEHALRATVKSLIWTVNPTTSEVSAQFPT